MLSLLNTSRSHNIKKKHSKKNLPVSRKNLPLVNLIPGLKFIETYSDCGEILRIILAPKVDPEIFCGNAYDPGVWINVNAPGLTHPGPG